MLVCPPVCARARLCMWEWGNGFINKYTETPQITAAGTDTVTVVYFFPTSSQKEAEGKKQKQSQAFSFIKAFRRRVFWLFFNFIRQIGKHLFGPAFANTSKYLEISWTFHKRGYQLTLLSPCGMTAIFLANRESPIKTTRRWQPCITMVELRYIPPHDIAVLTPCTAASDTTAPRGLMVHRTRWSQICQCRWSYVIT